MLVHSEIALGENEDTCYNVKNNEFSEKNRYEEYPVYLPRQHLHYCEQIADRNIYLKIA